MSKIIKNITILIFIHILADSSQYTFPAFIILLLALMGDKIETSYAICISIIITVLTIARLFVLPIAYKTLENSQQYSLISKFIHNLKQSLNMKITILIIMYFVYKPWCFKWFSAGIVGQFLESLLSGLLGSYLVLFAYWFVEDKIKNWKRLS